jgi:hypothetical protein
MLRKELIMRIFVILVSVLFVAYFAWARMDCKKRKIESEKKKNKPTFRTEGDVDEYAKPMENEHKGRVDFEDAE